MSLIDTGRHLNLYVFKIKLKKPKNIFLYLALLVFMIVATTFNSSGYIAYAGLLLGFVTLLKGPQNLLKKAGKFPPEVKILNFWVLWAGITGLLVAKNYDSFFNSLETVILMVGLINVIYLLLAYDIKLIKVVLFGFLSAAIFNYVAIQYGLVADEVIDKSRAYGLTGNPNSLGIKAMYSSFVLLLTMPSLNIIKHKKVILNILLLSAFFTLIVLSASRKSAITFAFIVGGYIAILFANKKERMKLSQSIVIILIFVAMLPFIIPPLISGTVLEERFILLEAAGGIEGDIRFEMVRFGLKLFSEHPLFGVGLDNYRHYAPFQMYSHNDFIESLASTGFIGFVLYQSFALIIAVRSFKLMKLSKIKTNRFYFAMILLGVLTVKVVGLGQIIYIQPTGMILLGAFASYTWLIQKEVRKNEIEI